MTTTFQEALEYASRATTAEIEQFYTVLKERSKMARKVEASLNASVLRPGDRVRLSDKMSPQYLRGVVAVVEELNGTKVIVHLEYGLGRFPKDESFSLSAAAVTKIEDPQ